MDFELGEIRKQVNGNEGAAHSHSDEVTASNGDGLTHNTSQRADTCENHSETCPGSNGDTHPSGHAAEAQDPLLPTVMVNANTHQQTSAVCKIKSELNEVIFWRIRLWMAIVFLFLIILAVIAISLVLCTVIHVDVDEEYDRSLFKIPRFFNGSFQLTNQVFTAELLTPSSNQSQALSAELQEKLANLYKSSPALGRYFSEAEIYAFRNGSVIAEYQLKFVMPADHDQLEKFTLSREVVFNVLRQFLYDQETEETEPMYIDPVSLTML
ncbi:TPA-induced transmembrane protein [Myripristis murdjan]|uniref:TPA-induced transmembrane protein n=1 Tax=Myripristis murdjan TaxID=586833 RepID=UPI0011762AF5|nr:TPA-induced transmembrane protein [Myripristis murdjan]